MNYLYILTKQEFTSLYHFGRIPIDQKQKIRIENNSTEQEKLILDTFSCLPYFSGDEEYLIINFDSGKLAVDSGVTIIEIEYISEIIPLTESAKYSFSQKFDSRLYFQNARFEKVFQELEYKQGLKERYHGAIAFSELCQTNKKSSSDFRKILEKAYDYRRNTKKSSEIHDDFYTHLFVYDRYEHFPKTDLGFYYDIGELYAHSMNLQTFKGSKFFQFLEENKKELNKKDILEIFEYIVNSNSNLKENFINQLTQQGIKKYLTAVIFLKLKDDLSKKDTIKESIVDKIINNINTKHKKLRQELDIAIFITGAFFGYKKFYGDLYGFKKLKIFENNNEYKNKPDRPEAEERENLSTKNEDSGKIEQKEEERKKNQLKDKISELIDTSNSFKIKNENLKKLRKVFTEAFGHHPYFKREDIIKYIKSNYSTSFDVDDAVKSKIILKIKER